MNTLVNLVFCLQDIKRIENLRGTERYEIYPLNNRYLKRGKPTMGN